MSIDQGKGCRRRPVDIQPVQAFLGTATPNAWLSQALTDIDILLIDHANCEKKAASTALSLLYRYVDRPELLNKLSRLAREELRHFEQVLAILKRRNVAYGHVSASRYAAKLMGYVRQDEPKRLVDTLIVGAFIEARSCERFAALVPHLDAIDKALADFYYSLLRSESRHFQDYLTLAKRYDVDPNTGASGEVADRVLFFRDIESALITEPDSEIRFHSGPVQRETDGSVRPDKLTQH